MRRRSLEWLAPRRDDAPIRATYVTVDPSPRATIGVLGSRPWWTWGLEHGVNEAGVAIGNEAIFTTHDPTRVPPALLGMDLVRLGLERAATAHDALEVMVELLDRYGQGGSGFHSRDEPYWSSFLVADPADAWVLETSGRQVATEQVSRSRAISNRTTIPAFDVALRDPSVPTRTTTDPRLRASQAVLAHEPVTVDALRRHLRDHTGRKGFSICMHVPGYAATTAALIAELPGPFASSRPLAHVCLGSPCSSLFVPIAVGRALGHPPGWNRFGALTTLDRDRLDALEARLAAAAPDHADSDQWAPGVWRQVEALLDTAAA